MLLQPLITSYEPLPKAEYIAIEQPNAPQIHNLVNKERERRGLKPLTLNIVLVNSAQAKCEDMQEHKYWSHSRPGKHWSEFIEVQYKKSGENLARQYNTDQGALTGWLNSPEHKANMLDDFIYVGYGFCTGYNRNLIVQHLAR
jgi:uncharacterized protein YkwD